MQVHPSGNYIYTVISSPNYTSLPFTVATFLATYLMVVMQSSGYSIFHNRDTPIQFGLLWWSYTPISISTLKTLLRVIGVIPLELQASPIVDIDI